MIFNLRMTRPTVTSFVTVEASELSTAACNFLGKNTSKALFVRPENAGRDDGDTSYFAQIEVEGVGEVTARYFFGGIGRHGGITTWNPNERKSLADVERSLGLADGSLTECDWEGEESADDAWKRERSKYRLT
jgi:hypothetical protein